MLAKEYRKTRKNAVAASLELAAEGVPVEPVYLQVDCPICGANGVDWSRPDVSPWDIDKLKLCPLHREEVIGAAKKFIASYLDSRKEPVPEPVIENGQG